MQEHYILRMTRAVHFSSATEETVMVRFEFTIRNIFWADRSRWPAQFLYYCDTMALVFDQQRPAALPAS